MEKTILHYFDLFRTTTLDLTDYLKSYNIKLDNYQPAILDFPELTSLKLWNSIVEEDWLDDYIIGKDSSLDNLSITLYDNPNYWWVILLVNNFENPFDIILSDKEILELAKLLKDEYNLYPLRVYQNLLFEYYNNRRNIKIIKPEYLPNFLKKIKSYANES